MYRIVHVKSWEKELRNARNPSVSSLRPENITVKLIGSFEAKHLIGLCIAPLILTIAAYELTDFFLSNPIDTLIAGLLP